MNQHYMAFFVALVFLAFPAKRRLLQYLIVLFYFWAGTLKLNRDWLSGEVSSTGEVRGCPTGWCRSACAYVVVLEMVLVFGLLSRRRWLFWATLGQLLLFHVMSYPVVGFYYPSLMCALLVDLPAVAARGAGSRPREPRDARTGREPVSTYVLLAGFSLLQLVPHAVPGRLRHHRGGSAVRAPHVRRPGGLRGARDGPRRRGAGAGGSRIVPLGAGARALRPDRLPERRAGAVPARGGARALDGLWISRCDPGGPPRRISGRWSNSTGSAGGTSATTSGGRTPGSCGDTAGARVTRTSAQSQLQS